MSEAPRPAGYRWWPAAVVLGLAGAALSVIWLVLDTRQDRVVTTGMVLAVSAFLLLGWACLLSRFPPALRRALFGLALAAGVVAYTSVEIRGVSGDLVPILAFRWSAEPDRLLPVEARVVPPGAAEALVRPEPPAEGSPPFPGPRDFPQFLGPERRAVVRSVRLARDWVASPPRVVWRRPIGAGWSGFAVAGGHAYTQEQRGEDELVVCYELETGSIVWSHGDPVRYEMVIAGVGPRATPTVTAHRLYALGATGILNCLDRQSGRNIWARDVIEDNDGNRPQWGKSCSPLVVGDLVVVSAGGRPGRSLVAYRAATGEPVWGGGDDRSAYSSPTFARVAGREQILILNKANVAAHDPREGTVLWSYPWAHKHPNVAQPLAVGSDRVFVSSGYGMGCALLRIDRDSTDRLAPVLLWRNRNLKAKFTNVVERGGFIYGLDDGILVCLDVESGERRWKGGRYGNGQALLVGDLLLVTTERGELVLVEPSPEEHRELGRFRALVGRTWATPALSGSRFLWRSDREAACWELPLSEES
ncbi:MAG: PQQ-like beta-propeller repeat protein [Planctomycetota bacterium]|nr:PQQ-like beta-propeller repeat protein [Planctomycetota bacterium]